MGWSHREYLSATRIFGCSTCRTHLATIDAMVSRVSINCASWGSPIFISSHTRHSMASTAAPTSLTKCEQCRARSSAPRTDIGPRVNVYATDPQERQMTTGVHIVRDIHCVKCHTILGWKYVSQRIDHCPWSLSKMCDVGSGVRGFSKVQGGQVHPGACAAGRRSVNACWHFCAPFSIGPTKTPLGCLGCLLPWTSVAAPALVPHCPTILRPPLSFYP